MGDNYPAEDRSTALLERRWFAVDRAAAETQAECAALARALEITQSTWQGARARLTQLEALREALGEELAAIHDRRARRIPGVWEKSAA